jgi:hypothetical protein
MSDLLIYSIVFVLSLQTVAIGALVYIVVFIHGRKIK